MRSKMLLAATLAALSACATLGFGRPDPKAFEKFYAAVQSMNGAEARKIADKAGLDRTRVNDAVYVEMWLLIDDGHVMTARDFAEEFGLDTVGRRAFAQSSFDALVRGKKCEYAADVAFWFDLGPRYADAAALCMETSGKSVYQTAGLACNRPGTEAQVRKRQKAALSAFAAIPAGVRDYDTMRTLIAVCRYDSADLRALHKLGLEDGAFEFVSDVLDLADSRGFKWADGKRWLELFDAMLAAGRIDLADMLRYSDALPKGPDILRRFIDGAVASHECGRAVRAALDGRSPDTVIEGIFGHAKCFGDDFVEIAGAVEEKDASKYFELALKHGKFTLARRLVDRLPAKKAEAFKRAEDAALAGFSFDEAMAFDPFPGEAEADRHERLLGAILGMKEEWFIVRWMKTRRSSWQGYPDDRFAGWLERCYLSALLRGAHELAADIAMEHPSEDFRKKGLALAFEEAIEAEDADGAYAIAKRRKLGDDALRQVALLKHRLIMEKERERAKHKKKRRKRSDDWEVKPDP